MLITELTKVASKEDGGVGGMGYMSSPSPPPPCWPSDPPASVLCREQTALSAGEPAQGVGCKASPSTPPPGRSGMGTHCLPWRPVLFLKSYWRLADGRASRFRVITRFNNSPLGGPVLLPSFKLKEGEGLGTGGCKGFGDCVESATLVTKVRLRCSSLVSQVVFGRGVRETQV